MTASRRTGALGAIALVSITTPVVMAAQPAASAAPAAFDTSDRAACAGRTGVTVVVDFGLRAQTRCAAGNPTTGLKALSGAGFTVVGTRRFPTFVCRINNVPAPSVEACVMPPPSTRYWSYWHAKRGGSWVFGSTGAASYDPKPGEVEGWAFGAGKPPTQRPPAAVGDPTS